MNIHEKECHWVKIENPPDEIEALGECTITTFECPYCKTPHQQFIELSKNPYKVGILCPECNTIYYGEWTEIKDGKLIEESKEIIIKTVTGECG